MLYKKFFALATISVAVLLSAVNTQVFAERNEEQQRAIETFEPGVHVQKAVAMLKEQIEGAPDKRIPQALLDAAKCVVVFPEVVQAGLGVGGKFGRGIVSCRQTGGSWGVPVFLRLNSLSIGLQAGGQLADIMMLVLQDDGLNTLFSGKPIVGGEVGIAAGPVGRSASANIDVALQAPIVTYTRSKGLFAGAVLDGAAITPAKTVNRGLYGEDYADAKALLFSDVAVPESVQGLRDALEKYAATKYAVTE